MAPKKQYAKLRASIQAQAQVLEGDRMADFYQTGDVIDALAMNLGTTMSGRKAALTAQHSRQLAALAGLRDRTAGGTARDIGRARRFSTNNYGSVATGMAEPLLRQADRHREGALATQRGFGRAGANVSAGGNAIMNILASGASEAHAAAEFQTAEALRYRAKEDASIIAEQQTQLMMMKAQAATELATQKKLLAYQKKLEEKDTTGRMQGLSMVTSTATEAAKTMRDYMAENPEATVNELIQQVTSGDSLLAEDRNALALLRQLALGVQQSTNDAGATLGGYSREDDAAAVADAINQLYPKFKDGRVEQTVLAGLNAAYLVRAAGGGGGGMTDEEQALDIEERARSIEADEYGYAPDGRRYDKRTEKPLPVGADSVPAGWIPVGRDASGRTIVAKPI